VAWPEAAEAQLSQSPPFSPAASPLQEPPSSDDSAQRALVAEGEGTRKKLIDVFEEPDDASELGIMRFYDVFEEPDDASDLGIMRFFSATGFQSAYRGHRAWRRFSTVRPSHDGNSPAIPAGNSNNSHDGNQPATSFFDHFPWIGDKSPREQAIQMCEMELLCAK
jgi:hypothetical protein